MKKILFLFFFIILFLQIISAVEFSMNNDFNQGETLIAKISGSFLEPPTEENIFFYRGHVKVPFDYKLEKINSEFYVYSLLKNKTPNNYSISIENVKYKQGTQISEENIVKNFSISNNTAEFSVDPGFLITNQDFFIEVQNLQDYSMEIEIKRTFGEDKTVSLISGEIKKISLELGSATEPVLELINFSFGSTNYWVPVYLEVDNETIEPINSTDPDPDKPEEDFSFEFSKLELALPTGSLKTMEIYLYNNGDETLEDITLFSSDSIEDFVNFSVEEIGELESGFSVRIGLEFYSLLEGSFDGEIIAETSGGLKTVLETSIEFTKINNFSGADTNTSNNTEGDITCSEMNGIICKSNEECINGTKKYAGTEICCLGGVCEEQKENISNKIIGWVLLVLVLILGYYFYKKSKGQTKKKESFFKPK